MAPIPPASAQQSAGALAPPVGHQAIDGEAVGRVPDSRPEIAFRSCPAGAAARYGPAALLQGLAVPDAGSRTWLDPRAVDAMIRCETLFRRIGLLLREGPAPAASFPPPSAERGVISVIGRDPSNASRTP